MKREVEEAIISIGKLAKLLQHLLYGVIFALIIYMFYSVFN